MANVRFVHEKQLRNEGFVVYFGSPKSNGWSDRFELFGSLGDLGRPMASKGDQSRPKGVQKTTKVGPKGAKVDQSRAKRRLKATKVGHKGVLEGSKSVRGVFPGRVG